MSKVLNNFQALHLRHKPLEQLFTTISRTSEHDKNAAGENGKNGRVRGNPWRTSGSAEASKERGKT